MADEVQAPIPFPELACARVTAIPGGFCVTFPGQAQFCASAGMRFGDVTAMTESLFASINSALMPLVPFFNVIDVFIAIKNCIEAIPQSLAPPNPKPILDCVKNLGAALQKLLGMLPPLSVPRLVKGILLALVLALSAFKSELQVFLAQQQRIIDAATLAAEPGNFELQSVVDCASSNFDVQIQNMNEALKPLNRLLGIVNILMEMAGQKPVPTLSDLGGDVQQALSVLDTAIDAMQLAAAAIPVDP